MKITVKSTFSQSPGEYETRATTVRSLLKEFSNSNTHLTRVQFFDCETGELYPDCDVRVNGKPYASLVNGLDTKLKDGDTVELIWIIIAGG